MRTRIFFLILAAACWWTYQTQHARDGAGDEAPAVSVDGAVAKAEGLQRQSVAARAEPAADRVVLCRSGPDSEYLRESECALHGGRVDEPTWARLD
jgi:hypothetical protein